MKIVKADKLTRSFNGALALDQLSLEIETGEIFGLVGPDGSGKSTALRLFSGILDPTSGDAWVCGKHIVREAAALKENIAYVPQRFGLYRDLTVLENLSFYADIFHVPRRERGPRIERLLRFAGLESFRRRRAGQLSGGMEQKLGLACALVHTPRVLLLDEPTSGVDPIARRDFWQILHQLRKEGVTILFSTSYLDEAERCRRVGLLYRGCLLRCEGPDRIKRERNAGTLEEAFISIISEKDSGRQGPDRR